MIGILAGMGPHSTAPFHDLVISECQKQYGAKDDIDFPKMMIYSLPVPFFPDRPINHPLMEKTLIHGLQQLEKTGVNFIAIACNTAHVYYPQLARSIQVPLLNMVQLTANTNENRVKKIALIAARPTVESGIYQTAFHERGLDVLDIAWQFKVDSLIATVRDKNDPYVLSKMWSELITIAKNAGGDTCVLACMDLSAIRHLMNTDMHVIDAGECLAREVVANWRNLGNFYTPVM